MIFLENVRGSDDSTDDNSEYNHDEFMLDNSDTLLDDAPESYEFHEKLGEGAFSVVYKAVHIPTGRAVAIKVISKEKLTTKQLANISNEINIMKRVSHPHVLQLIDSFNNPRHCYIVLEFCDGGEIFNKIIEYTYFSEALSCHVFTQLLSAVEYLHSINVVHRDIKPENLLFKSINYRPRSEADFLKCKRKSDDNTKVDEGDFLPNVGGGTIGIIKLGDFGLAKQLKFGNSLNSHLKTPCGTAGYTAPEVITCNPRKKKLHDMVMEKNYYSKAVDIWSLGCLLYTILCGFPPFYDDVPERLTCKILTGDFVFLEPWWDEISSEVKDLISRMLVIDPTERITLAEIWKHPWVLKHHKKTVSPSYFAAVDTEHVEHIENVQGEAALFPPKSTKNPLNSPRADAIKMVFNNPAMGNVSKLDSKYSVHFGSALQHDASNDIKSKLLPKSPFPEREGVSFRDVFKPQEGLTTIAALAEDSDECEDESFGPSNHQRNSYSTLQGQSPDELDSEEEFMIESLSLSSNFTNRNKPTETEPFPVVRSKHVKGSQGSIHSTTSEDECSFHEGDDTEYQTRSSSIISGMNGDFKFTLNLNDSNILRRRSTIKSNKSLPVL